MVALLTSHVVAAVAEAATAYSRRLVHHLHGGTRNLFLKERKYVSCLAVRVRASTGNGADGKYDYDLFTIGAGSGGVRGSRFASSYGKWSGE